MNFASYVYVSDVTLWHFWIVFQDRRANKCSDSSPRSTRIRNESLHEIRFIQYDFPSFQEINCRLQSDATCDEAFASLGFISRSGEGGYPPRLNASHSKHILCAFQITAKKKPQKTQKKLWPVSLFNACIPRGKPDAYCSRQRRSAGGGRVSGVGGGGANAWGPVLQFARQHLKQGRLHRAGKVDPLLFLGYSGESHCNIHVVWSGYICCSGLRGHGARFSTIFHSKTRRHREQFGWPLL